MKDLFATLGSVGMILCATATKAEGDLRPGGELLLTQGVNSLEGAAGGGSSTWTLIAGYETRNGIGANDPRIVKELVDRSLADPPISDIFKSHDRLP